jgi:hypothetical protein
LIKKKRRKLFPKRKLFCPCLAISPYIRLSPRPVLSGAGIVVPQRALLGEPVLGALAHSVSVMAATGLSTRNWTCLNTKANGSEIELSQSFKLSARSAGRLKESCESVMDVLTDIMRSAI